MSDDTNVIEFSEAQLSRMRNLKPYRGMTDEQLLEALKSRQYTTKRGKKDQNYDEIFNAKLADLQREYAVDMNNSNDAENLKMIVRLQIQSENVSKDIDTIQRKERLTIEDHRALKNLGDVQRTVIQNLNEVQTHLGISRKIRKEKAADDIPVWIDNVLARAKKFYDGETTQIYCPKCQIELGRFWLNFPNANNDIQLSLQCWKCKEQVEHIQ